ncbi:transcriptional and immune response regulator a [Salminus brasiliensis]|uniref:transcriptional and immune response regulator a n=1 Tax=Salminus brasiliensis TaxID=930266 RepID=UPI003B838F20
MSSYSSSESRRVTPRVHGSGFDTARRKRASPHIFEHVREDALARLFRKAGDAKAEERARSVFAAAASHEPGETARALMALRQRKKDKLLRIAGAVRRFLGVR